MHDAAVLEKYVKYNFGTQMKQEYFDISQRKYFWISKVEGLKLYFNEVSLITKTIWKS